MWNHKEKSNQPASLSEFLERNLYYHEYVFLTPAGKLWINQVNSLFSPLCPTHFYLSVSVGFEYETCPSLILWEKRTALLQGFELDPSNLGGWSLDKHHILNVKSGMWAHLLSQIHPDLSSGNFSVALTFKWWPLLFP